MVAARVRDWNRVGRYTVTVTKIRRCEWCGTRFAVAGGPGRPAKYCRRSHRQRHYEARREAERLGIDGVMVGESDWQELLDAVYRLEAAIDDAVVDVAGGDPPERVLRGLAEAVRDLTRAVPEPAARR